MSQFSIILRWFSSNQVSTALSVIASVDRLSTALCDNIEPSLVESTSLEFGLWFGFMICLISFGAALILNYYDRQKHRLLEGAETAEELVADMTSVSVGDGDGGRFRCGDLKKLNWSFWLLCLNCGLVNADVYCFNNIASKYFQDRFGYNSVEAGRIISITFLISGVLCPVVGVLLDKVGRRVYFIGFSAVATTAAHVMFLITPDSHMPVLPIFYVVVLGLGFSVYTAVIWSSVPYVVEDKLNEVGFGILASAYNLALVIFPIFVGLIQENNSQDQGYYWVSALLIGVGALGIISTVALYFVNKREGSTLIQSNSVLRSFK